MRGADEGQLDPEAAARGVAASGLRVRQRPRELPAGLTERELEVLLVLVRGESNQEIAERGFRLLKTSTEEKCRKLLGLIVGERETEFSFRCAREDSDLRPAD